MLNRYFEVHRRIWAKQIQLIVAFPLMDPLRPVQLRLAFSVTFSHYELLNESYSNQAILSNEARNIPAISTEEALFVNMRDKIM